jgi:hypothetical protein
VKAFAFFLQYDYPKVLSAKVCSKLLWTKKKSIAKRRRIYISANTKLIKVQDLKNENPPKENNSNSNNKQIF